MILHRLSLGISVLCLASLASADAVIQVTSSGVACSGYLCPEATLSRSGGTANGVLLYSGANADITGGTYSAELIDLWDPNSSPAFQPIVTMSLPGTPPFAYSPAIGSDDGYASYLVGFASNLGHDPQGARDASSALLCFTISCDASTLDTAAQQDYQGIKNYSLYGLGYLVQYAYLVGLDETGSVDYLHRPVYLVRTTNNGSDLLTSPGPLVPEPASLGIFGLTGFIFWAGLFRRRVQQD